MENNSLRRMVYAAMFGALTAVGSFIIIPVQPVPITLQTFFTYLAGILLGGIGGALSQIVYVLLGLIGLPVFAGGTAGLGILLGPSGGYLIGFIVGAGVIGKIVESQKKPGLPGIILAVMLGTIVIYFFGILQLILVAHLTLKQSFFAGAVPFLPGDMLKLLAAGLLAVKLRDYIKL